MKGKIFVILSLVLVVALSLALIPSCAPTPTPTTPTPTPAAPTKTYKVGCTMAFTGPAVPWSTVIRQGMECYAELTNEDGGLKIGDDTYLVELYFADDKYLPEGCTSATQELVYNKKIDALVGNWCPAIPAVSAVTEPEKVINICMSWPGWDATEYPYTFFGTPALEFQFGQLPAFISIYPDIKKVGWPKPDWWPTDGQELVDFGAELGIDVYVVEFAAPCEDFTTQLAKFAEYGIDGIYSLGPAEGEVWLMVKQMYEAGYDWHFYANGMLPSTQDFIDIAGYEAAQGVLHDWMWPPAMRVTPISSEMVTMAERIAERYEEKFGKPMEGMSGFGYGTGDMSLLFDALKQAGSTDPDKVREVLWGGTFDTFRGTWTMGGQETHNGPIVQGYPCVTSKIEGNKQVYAGEYAYTVP